MLFRSGYAQADFEESLIGRSYYLGIFHRNTLETWSAQAVKIGPGFNYDFTDNATKALGAAQMQLGTNIYGLYSGDLNQDGSINRADLTFFEQASFFTTGTYSSEDLNGDGIIESADYSFLENGVSLAPVVVRP